MKASNFGDVGQIRRRKGTSIKRITNAEALKQVRLRNELVGNECDSHADDTYDNQKHIERKDVRNT
jgi:hypothetical protein